MSPTNNILSRIIDNKRRELDAMNRLNTPVSDNSNRAKHSMRKALLDSPTGIIAEFKRRSPSRGDIHPMAMVSDIVPAYARNGAAACSILTDTPFFGGAVTDLAAARTLVDLPLLRKDFIIDSRQVLEAAACGADAILLIAAALSADQIASLTDTAHRCRLEVLLELHSVDELDRFCPAVDMVGVNNRNLATFDTDTTLSLTVAKSLPDNVVKVAESGLTSMPQVLRLRDAGYRGFLIGERFMSHTDPGLALHNFILSE